MLSEVPRGARKELIYLFPKAFVFVRRDLELLGHHYVIKTHELLRGPRWALPFRMMHQLIFLLRHAAWNKDVICHFSGYHSVIPAILAKRLFIILAGSDCASFPNLDYGNFRKALYGWATGFSMRNAHLLLPVHKSLLGMQQHYDPEGPVDQGVKAFVPGITTPAHPIPYGFDVEHWKVSEHVKRHPELYMCVASGAASGNNTHFRKGIDLILSAAPQFPEQRFLIVGSSDPTGYKDLPSNVEVLGKTDQEALKMLYHSSAFYLQVSVMEGFPNALCEAMACGCIPIVSNMVSMPEIVGAHGLVVQQRSTVALAGTIRRTLTFGEGSRIDMSIAAQKSIAERFSVAHREKELLSVLA